METYDRGSPVLIEVEYKKRTPFSTAAYFDPTDPKVTVTDPTNTVRVDAQDLTKSAVGKYYYVVQSAAGWPQGRYTVTVTGGDGTYTDVENTPESFELV